MKNNKAMFDFALEQKKIWQETKDDTYRVAWETARHMIHIAGLWDEWTEYIKNSGIIANQKKKWIVRRFEEELGEEVFVVLVPETEDRATVNKNLEMASRYAQVDVTDWECFDDDEKARYDEHLEEMGSIRELLNGDEMFIHYLINYCDYEVDYLKSDFRYEW